jgi:integrase/recombinase XerC
VKRATSQKVEVGLTDQERLIYWKERFMEEEIRGDRSRDVENKIELQLNRFIDFFSNRYGHDRVAAVVKRDVKAWIKHLYKDPDADEEEEGVFAASTVNNHKAHLSKFFGWLHNKAPHLFPEDPSKELNDILLPAPDARALTDEQYNSLKHLCDRLERFHLLRGRRWKGKEAPIGKKSRPKRDRAIVFTFLSCGIRREMLVNLNMKQLQPNDPSNLRTATSGKIVRIRGRGNTEVTKFLNEDARKAIADYLEFERDKDVDPDSKALFLTAAGVPDRKQGGRMSVRSINRILEQIAIWHDAEQEDPERKIAPLTPHTLRHTYGFRLGRLTHGDRNVLKQELGHRNDRYLDLYTKYPDMYRAEITEKM